MNKYQGQPRRAPPLPLAISAMDTEVSLDEVLKVLGEEPIDERAAWGVLVQSYKALQLWAGKRMDWLWSSFVGRSGAKNRHDLEVCQRLLDQEVIIGIVSCPR